MNEEGHGWGICCGASVGVREAEERRTVPAQASQLDRALMLDRGGTNRRQGGADIEEQRSHDLRRFRGHRGGSGAALMRSEGVIRRAATWLGGGGAARM